MVDNQMTDDQFNHSEEMAKTKLTNPEFGMKVFVFYTDQKNPQPIWVPAVITGVSTMFDGSIEINVRYLDGSTFNNRVILENVVYRDESVSYENWTLHGYDPRTMLDNGQARNPTGSRSRPFVTAPPKKAAFHGGSSSGGGASGGSSSGGGAAKRSSPGGKAAKRASPKAAKGSSSGGGAAKGASPRAAERSSLGGGAVQKKRKMENAKTGKQAMDKEDQDRKGAEWTVEDSLDEVNGLLHESYEDNDRVILERDAAVDRAHQSDLRATAAEERATSAEARIAAAEAAEERATAAEARIAAAEERATAAEARATAAVAGLARANRSTRPRTAPANTVYDHGACRDYKGMGGGN